MKKLLVFALLTTVLLTGCDEEVSQPTTKSSKEDTKATIAVGDTLATNQPTPTDIDYSLERYNLIKRAYWVNGQREKANTLVCEIDKPLGYIVLFTESGSTVGRFIVDGKITSLNSYLSPDSIAYECGDGCSTGGFTLSDNKWVPDVDGSYGENDSGIFFFTPDGKYVEWTGTYLYSDIPFEISDPVVKVGDSE